MWYISYLNNVWSKVGSDIVCARGLLKVRMLELVIFNLSVYGIVNYLDKGGVAGITVLGNVFSIIAQTKVTRLYLQPSISYYGSIIIKKVFGFLHIVIKNSVVIKSRY